MKYGVVGPRDYNGQEYVNYEHVRETLQSFPDASLFISGGSKGVERLVEKFAKETDIELLIVRPDINRHGPTAAFFIRNTEIIQRSDALIIFWDGTAPRVIDLLAQCMKSGKEVNLIPMV